MKDVNFEFEQKAIIIKEKGDIESIIINCVILKLSTGRHVQYPRSLLKNSIKYIMTNYLVENDLLIYRETKDDPWFRGDK